MNKKTAHALIYSVCTVLFIATMIVYVIMFSDSIRANNIAFGFLLFSEFALCGTLIFNTIKTAHSKIFINAGVGVSALIYTIFTAIMLAISNSFADNTKYLLTIEVIGLALFLILSLIIIIFNNRINATNEKTAEDRALMQICEKRIYNLIIKPENKQYLEEINEIYESIKFSDKIGISSIDEKIVGAIMKLEKEIGSEKTISVIENIKSLLAERNMEISEGKRGGF